MEILAVACSTFVSVLFFAGFALTFVKFYCENTMAESRYRLLEGAAAVPDCLRKKTPYGKIILFAVGIRLLMMLAGLMICLIFQSDGAFNLEAFVAQWHKWDSTGYTNMAKEGYYYLEDGENILLVFFPLYSICMRVFAELTGNYYISGVLVSVLCYIGAMVYIYKLASIEFSERVAWKTVVLMSVFPFSFFFGSIHTESVTLFMMAATFYYIRQHRWPLVCLFGILSGLSRMVGSLVAVAALVEYIRFYRPFDDLKHKNFRKFWQEAVTKFIFIPLIAIGGLIYLGANYVVAGNPFQFLEYQQSVWHNTTQFLPVTVTSLFRWTFGNFDTLAGCIWIPEIFLLILVSVFMIARWRRLPSMYGVFLGCYLLISYAASTLLSAGRYLSIAFPFFFLLADWTDEKNSRYEWTVIISALFLGIYLTAFLLNRQVM